jgi:hypothetical protein
VHFLNSSKCILVLILNSIRAFNSIAYPFLAWSRFALSVGQMAASSAEVIAHRTGRVAFSCFNPAVSDQRELALMAQEKQDAARESLQGMVMPMFGLWQQAGILAQRQMWASALSAMSIASSSTPAQFADRQAKAAGEAVRNSTVAAANISRSTATIARRALKPIHGRVKANVKRLRKS